MKIIEGLSLISEEFPKTLERDMPYIKRLYACIETHRHLFYGMTASCSIPTRTTLLHFLYPKVIPLSDKQVLLAVGINEKDANKKYSYLFEYIQFAWNLSNDPSLVLQEGWIETPLRLVDMALWVIRGGT